MHFSLQLIVMESICSNFVKSAIDSELIRRCGVLVLSMKWLTHFFKIQKFGYHCLGNLLFNLGHLLSNKYIQHAVVKIE